MSGLSGLSGLSDLVGQVDDDDVAWASRILGLTGLDEARRDFLTTMDSVDVTACPGSGKTTLVVAKLAILARKWKSRTKGICVLSHTNVAREEIEGRLAGTEVGHLLLGHPHYIDTIHGFVNRFLAVPWLLSNGHAVTAIDDDITGSVRRRNLGSDFYLVSDFLSRKRQSIEKLRLQSANFEDPLGDAGFPAGRGTRTYQAAARALAETARQGYFCHDEMLLFGEELLRQHPEAGRFLPLRFPVLLIDETQDTSARQDSIISAALPFSRLEAVQRVGDPNQAIFDDDATAAAFPHLARRPITLSSSFRFDDSIASRASGLAVDPLKPWGLQGERAVAACEPPGRHVIFVFPDDDPARVIPAYAAHVARVMTAMEPARPGNGSVIAIGEVHRVKDDVKAGDPKFPATVSHYWDGYRPESASRTPRPRELIGYMRAARALTAAGRSAEAVNMIAAGIARIANTLSTEPVVRAGLRPHLALERQLEASTAARAAYRAVLRQAAPDAGDSRAQWEATAADARAVTAALLDVPPSAVKSSLLDWIPPTPDGGGEPGERAARPNVQRITAEGRVIDVRMGSIHAVKGETHFATLVLETHNHAHSIRSLLPWLLGDASGPLDARGKPVAQRQRKRLRLHYVALTRSSHVICLAIPEAALATAGERRHTIARLEARGWKVTELEPAATG
jgi:DNA helicase-2/ATP-dependent DNA helicase PcrA